MANLPDMSQIMKLAQSPTGQKLISLIQKAQNGELDLAMEKVNAGDYAGAKDVLASLLSSPEAQRLIKQLENQK